MGKRALFVYTHLSTFVKGDLEILSRHCIVDQYRVENTPKMKLPLSLIKLFFYLLLNIRKFDVIYIWFADYHSFLPVLFSRITGKRSMIVIGGYDICREREYRYGSLSSPLRSFMALTSIKLASLNLCVSNNIRRVVKSIAPKSNSTLLYNGVNISTTFFKERESTIENDSFSKDQESILAQDRIDFLCVALTNSIQAFYIKGIDRYIRIASSMEDKSFVLIGCNPDVLKGSGFTIPSNLTVIPAIEHSMLKNYYKRTRVYCQFSRRESFSLSLAEAMLFNCVPVVTNVGGMPEVTGGVGLIKEGDNIDELRCSLLSALKEASEPFKDYSKAVLDNISPKFENSTGDNFETVYRRRVLEHFTIEKRERELIKILFG